MPDTTTEIIFVDEPPPSLRRGRTSPVVAWLDALRSYPHRWAKYPTAYKSYGGIPERITTGNGYGVAPGEFEAVSRPITNGRYELYARYVGPVTPPNKNGTGT